ncbi:MAG TPA: extracellular solute-binding protein, partial [Thermomicrobiales bacterium]|nr:extracellular solute-binding protein [Thermomicrobiales bacterium]
APIALGAKDGWPAEHWYMNFLVQRCGVETVYKAIDKNGAKFTDDCFVQAAADLQSLAQKGYFSAGATSDDYGAAQAVFLSGQSPFFQTGSWFASGWEETPPPFEVGIMPFPRMADSKFPNDVTGAVTHVFGIPTQAKNPDGAMAFLDWLTSDDAAAIWAKNGNMSLIKGAVEANSPQVIKDLWATVGDASAALPWIENELPPGVGEDKVYSGTVALLTGSMTPEQFSQSIQDALDAS